MIIIDDHPFVRTATRLLLAKEKRYQVVGEASDGVEGLALVASLKPDLATLDIQMPGLSLEDIVNQALEIDPGLKILVISTLTDDGTIDRIRKLPIAGYLVKNESTEHLVEALNAVVLGIPWYSECIAGKLNLAVDFKQTDEKEQLSA